MPHTVGRVVSQRTVLHVIGAYDRHEGIATAIAEVAMRSVGDHHLACATLETPSEVFTSTSVLPGRPGTFPYFARRELGELLERVGADVVHLHGGPFTATWARAPVFSPWRPMLSFYGWPRLPGPTTWSRIDARGLYHSQVARPRVIASSVLPTRLVRNIIETRCAGVLTPDPRVVSCLAGLTPPVIQAVGGGSHDPRRASFDDENPVIVFAGRAERVRGIDVLLDAFTIVRSGRRARLRLLLLPLGEPDRVRNAVAHHRYRDDIELDLQPSKDLRGQLAQAQVGVWPFLFDYTTSPQPLALIEALSVGLPMVGTDVACIGSVLRDGEGGYLVPPADTEALAGALLKVLSHKSVWTGLAERGAVAADARSWDQVARLVGNLYDHAQDLQERDAGPGFQRATGSSSR